MYLEKVNNSNFHGLDLSMIILSKMLKVVILMQHPDYLWLSCPDVNVKETSVVLVYDLIKKLIPQVCITVTSHLNKTDL